MATINTDITLIFCVTDSTSANKEMTVKYYNITILRYYNITILQYYPIHI